LFSRNIKRGILGIINATKIYHNIQKRALPNVRTLFASTGVKGDEYVADYYITNLLLENSINTAPIDTIKAFVKTEIKEKREPIDIDIIDGFFEVIKEQEFDMDTIYKELMDEGVEAFKDAFADILKTL
jgi:transaldolase